MSDIRGTIATIIDESTKDERREVAKQELLARLDPFSLAGIIDAFTVLDANERRDFWYLGSRHLAACGDVLKAPKGKYSEKERAAAWSRVGCDNLKRYAWLMVKAQRKGWEELRNADENFFEKPFNRPKLRTSVARFLTGEGLRRDHVLFLRDRKKILKNFPAREMFLYAIVHCKTAKHFETVLELLRKDLRSGNIVDAQGFSPYFYLSFRKDLRFSGEGEEKSESEKICDLIQTVGARIDKKCRYGFSWQDYVEVMQKGGKTEDSEEMGCFWQGSDEKNSKAGTRYAKLKTIVPLQELPSLLRTDPDAGIECLAAQAYCPESKEVPFGDAERILGDAISNASTTRKVKAKLFRTFVIDPEAWDCAVEEAKDIPAGLLDFRFARKWYCDRQKPGWKYVWCSDQNLFAVKVNWDPKTKIEKTLDAAIASEKVSVFAMNLALVGQAVGARLLSVLLSKQAYKILSYMVRNDKEFSKKFDERALLFYACANWEEAKAIEAIRGAEEANPGICKGCRDEQGRGLFWYLRYYNGWRYKVRAETIGAVLKEYGCDPRQDTVWGISFEDIREGRLELPYQVFEYNDRVVVESGSGYKVNEYHPPVYIGKLTKDDAWTHDGFGVCTHHDWPDVTYRRVRLFEFEKCER